MPAKENPQAGRGQRTVVLADNRHYTAAPSSKQPANEPVAPPTATPVHRGSSCDLCKEAFAGDPSWTTVLWEHEHEPGRGRNVFFAHKDCLYRNYQIDRLYVFCGGGAWFDRKNQLASIDRLLSWDALSTAERLAVGRYRAFCGGGAR